VEDFVSGGSELSTTDLTNRKTHEAHYNDKPLGEILGQFRVARRKLLARVEEIDPVAFAHSLVHPRLQKPMRLVDHLFFVAEHDDHHLAWMWALLHSDSD
jgi:hypothetical protein